MSLPLSGPLSFSDIASVIGVDSPYSLGTMSANAGFTSPDSVSEFYGYGPGGGLTLFFVSQPPTNLSQKVCQMRPSCCTPVWHNGIGALPEPGDFVYTDSAGTVPLMGFKAQFFYGMDIEECVPAFNWLLISDLDSGQVLEVGGCF